MATMKALFPVSSPIAGVSYFKRQSVIAELNDGDPLFFKRERGNPYDPEAVAVLDIHDRHVGYLPNKPQEAHEFKEMIFNSMDKGRINAIAYAKRGGYNGKNYGISVRFFFIPDEYFLRGYEAKDDDDEPVKPKRKNSAQAPKRKGYEWKDEVKRHHKGRYTYHEIEALKERKAG